jgi:chromatin modification-related protein YNG2
VLAQQIIDLVSRTRARLEVDIAKVRILQGEIVEYPGYNTKSNGTPVGGGYVLTGRNPALQITESLRTALANSPSMGDVSMQAPSPPAFNGPSNKSKYRVHFHRPSGKRK